MIEKAVLVAVIDEAASGVIEKVALVEASDEVDTVAVIDKVASVAASDEEALVVVIDEEASVIEAAVTDEVASAPDEDIKGLEMCTKPFSRLADLSSA